MIKLCFKCKKNPAKLAACGKSQGYCRQCFAAYQKAYYHANLETKKTQRDRGKNKRKAIINELKDRPCMDCGNSYPSCCMDFDHRDAINKLIDVSDAVCENWPMTRVIAEIAKCDLVCSNCHRIRTRDGRP